MPSKDNPSAISLKHQSLCGLKLKSWVVKLLVILACIPLLLFTIRIIRLWVTVRSNIPTDVFKLPKPHFSSPIVVGTPPADFHDPWYCNINCKFGQPCEYWDEVDFRIIVMTQTRASSLEKCLRAIQDLEMLNDRVSVEIWADLLPDGTINKNVSEKAEQFKENFNKFSNKRACFHKQKGNANIGGQWVDTWRPKEDTEELGLILEDDVIISKYAYRWIKGVHAAYGKQSNVAGYTLQMENTQWFAPMNNVHNMKVDKNQTVFMYPVIGTWGYAPHPKAWRTFQDWYHTVRPDLNVKTDFIIPRVPWILPDRWYQMFRRRGQQEGMWSMWHIKFSHDFNLFTIYCNMKQHLGRGDILLSTNRQEPGLHFSGNPSDNSKQLLRKWMPEFEIFPKPIWQLNYDGNRCTAKCCFSAVCDGILNFYFSQTTKEKLLLLQPWRN